MLFLVLSVICSVAIGHILHIVKNKNNKVPILQIFLGNYFLASVISFLLIEEFDTTFRSGDLGLGAVFGTLFLVNFLIYQENIFKNGMSISISVMRVSLVVPVAVSILVFGEHLQAVKYIGIAIVILAFVLMGRKGSIKYKFWLLALFVCTGFTELGLKFFKELADTSNNQMIFYLFTFAFIINLILIIYKKKAIQWKYIAIGLLLGIPNQLTSFFFLKGLNNVDASLAYPFVASNVVLLGFISDKIIWRTKFSKFQYVIFGLILIGVILLNIK